MCLLTLCPHVLALDLQAMALCLDDKIQFRLQWPTSPVLRFNNKMLRVSQRGNCSALGIMQVWRVSRVWSYVDMLSAGGVTPEVSFHNVHSDVQTGSECMPVEWTLRGCAAFR
jgi:hypothetical protein